MRNDIAIIAGHERIAAMTWEMTLKLPPTQAVQQELAAIRPGQFINLKLAGYYLRRPISISDWSEQDHTITIVYKVVGRGTRAMSRMQAEESIDLLWPLGNGYDLTDAEEDTDASGPSQMTNDAPLLLIGGGAGVPPMAGLCRALMELKGKETPEEPGASCPPVVILGFRSAQDAFYQERFEDMGARVIVTTEDGSMGRKGFVTDAIEDLQREYGEARFHGFFSCGPEQMLQAVCQTVPEGIPGQLSFEERMGCGFGACMGCSCRTKYGSKRICKDGPVLRREEIVW